MSEVIDAIEMEELKQKAEGAPTAEIETDADLNAEDDAFDESDEEEEDYESEDSLTFSNGVIEKIVALAMRDIPGVVGMKVSFLNMLQDAFGASDARKGVTVEVTPESAVRVNVSVLIEYGAYAPQVFEDVKKAIVGQVVAMTGLDVAGVNLRIEDVLTPEEIAQRQRRQMGAARDEQPKLEEAEDVLEDLEGEYEAEDDVVVELEG